MNQSLIPKVSVCLPNLNNARFLPDRLESIKRQTVREIEVVVSDNFSEDGAWPLFISFAEGDARARVFQSPRNGMYANWNVCVEAARGDWIYVATSDDSMVPECLEELLSAADQVAQCDLVTSAPWTTDEAGVDTSSVLADRLGRILIGRRVRRGPLDGRRELVAGMLFGTPTLSMTQMIIRKSLFSRVGLFPTEFGSAGDYVWQMRAFQKARAAYVPRKLGSWRQHVAQATSANVQSGVEGRARMLVKMWRDGELPLGADIEVALGIALAWGREPVPDGMPVKVHKAARLMGGRRRSWTTVMAAIGLTRTARFW